MEQNQIQWIKPTMTTTSFISIQKDFINMSVTVSKALGMPKHVRLGVIEENNTICLFPSHELDDLAFRVQKNRIIYCRSFLKQIRDMFHIKEEVINRLKTECIDQIAYVRVKK